MPFRKRKNEKGAITVEATIALTAFLFMFIMLYSIITVCRAQAIVGSALNNTAKEISQYTYLYSLTGIHKSVSGATRTSVTDNVDDLAEKINETFNSMQGLNNDASTLVQSDINDLPDLMNSWSTISTTIPSDIDKVKGDVKALSDSIEELAKDPKSLLIGLCKIAANDGISMVKSQIITPPICRALIGKHLKESENQSTEDFLKNLNIVPDIAGGDRSYIKGLNFSNSSLYSSDRYDIVLRVEYKVKILPFLPMNIEINLSQSAATRGWADGDGRHVKEDGSVEVVTAPGAK